MDASVGEAQPGHSLSRRRQSAKGLKDFFGPKEAIGEIGRHCKVEPLTSMLLFAFWAPAM